jgi:minor histocompatibility antigen H13
MADPGLVTQIIGRLAFEFAKVQHLIPTYLHIILAALFPIYTAAHGSLSRPSSAAKPPKKKSKKEWDDDEDDEDDKPRMEGLSPSDAILFPLSAGIALTSLYFLIKWDKELLNKILSWYMSSIGLFGVIKFIADALHLMHSFAFPDYYSDGARIWKVDQNTRKAFPTDAAAHARKSSRSNPLPGLLSKLPLPQRLNALLWNIRAIPNNKLTFKLYLHKITAVRVHLNAFHFVSLFLGVSATGLFMFVSKPWYLTNLMGFAFSYTAMQILSPTTFTTATMVLIGLFFYDIYMVFFT